MIVSPRDPATTPLRTALPWVLTGWGVALLGVGFALGILLLALVLAPIVVVMVP